MRTVAFVRTAIGAIATVVLLALPASGAPPEIEAAAQRAFDEGMALMEAGKHAEACPRLKQAQKLDPGMANQFRLAECYEAIGKLASAWRNFAEVSKAARAAGLKDREQQAGARADALRDRLSVLRIDVPTDVADVPGIVVTQNGEEVDREAWGAKLPVDGGTVQVEAAAPGYRPWTVSVTVAGEGASVTVKVEPLAKPGSEPAGGATPTGEQGGGTSGQPGPEGSGPDRAGAGDEAGGMSGQAIAGIVVGVVGIAAMGAGVAVGLAAGSSYDDAEAHCVDSFCNEEGIDIRESARTQADVATVVFSVGAAALVGGVVLWLTAPSDSEPATEAQARLRVGVTPGGLTVGGVW